MLCSQSPRMKQEFKDTFDVELMEQMIKKSIFTPLDFIKYSEYVIDILLKLMAPIKIQETKEIWDTMKMNIMNGDIGEFDKVVPYVLKYVYQTISDIKDDILMCDTMSNLGLNPFNI